MIASVAAPRAVSERSWQATVLDACRLFGWRVYHTYDSRRSQPGFPDLVLLRGERLLFVELKTERGRVSPAQIAWIDALRAAGQEVGVFRPSEWERLVRVLRGEELMLATLSDRRRTA